MKHKKEIPGYTIEELAKVIGALHYETLEELLRLLGDDILEQSKKDKAKKRVLLAEAGKHATSSIKAASMYIGMAKMISQPYQEK